MDVAARYFTDYMLHQSKSSTFLIRKISQATNWLGQLYIYIHTCKYFHYLLLILILNNIFCRNMTIDVSAQYCLKVYLFEEKKKKATSSVGLIIFEKMAELHITYLWNSQVYSWSEKRRLFHARNRRETKDLIQSCVILPSKSSKNNWAWR